MRRLAPGWFGMPAIVVARGATGNTVVTTATTHEDSGGQALFAILEAIHTAADLERNLNCSLLPGLQAKWPHLHILGETGMHLGPDGVSAKVWEILAQCREICSGG